jgi:hypothetical protein
MKEEIPGVTLHFRGSEVQKGTDTKTAKITLSATIHDDAVWEAVERKLIEGLQIYTVNDFKTELLSALRKENMALEQKLQRLETTCRQAQEENRHMKAALSVLSRELSG